MLSSAEKYKSRVCKSFSSHAGSYDRNAGIQSLAAELSAQILLDLKNNSAIPDGEILEVGCGTGLLSSKLIKLFPGRKIIFSDISAEMLDMCRHRLASETQNLSAEFRLLDAEALPTDKKYALITSSFAVQWFFRPLEGITRLVEALERGGSLVFSTPGSESCPAWKAAAEAKNLPFTRNPMPSAEELQKLAIRSRLEFRLQSRFAEERHADAGSMLRSLKELGAATQKDDIRLSCTQLRRLLRELDSKGSPVEDCYQIITGRFRKTELQSEDIER